MDEESYEIIERALDYSFKGKFLLNFYQFLQGKKATKKTVDSFIESTTAQNIKNIVCELDQYIKGGSDSEHKQLREAYGYLGKPEARKIRKYLNGILEDAQRYSYDRRPGRRKKVTK
jgi:hypothetical protein|tara:strand:+ start:724 stop:1074 length:351 start_codon:yes stop_codon:yes gene_type:complete